IWTVTMPPPAEASTRIWAMSCCSFCCISCAWRIICCMLPGNFTSLLLQVSDFVNLAVEHVAESLDLRIGQRAAGGIVFPSLGCGPERRGRLGRLIHANFDAQRARGNLLYGFLQIFIPQ